MISIKKYMRGSDSGIQSLVPVIQMLLQGIVSQLVEFEPQPAERFRASVQEIADGLNDNMPLGEFLVHAGAVINSLEEYNVQATACIQAQRAELHMMLKMLTDTVTSISKGSHDSISKLRNFEEQLKSTTGIVDVRVLKMRLSDCLADICEESQRQRQESEFALKQLTQEIARARQYTTQSKEFADRDPCTGLRMRDAAERVIGERCLLYEPSFVAILTVERLQTYNTRFGRVIGDQMFRYFASEVQAGISEGDQLFRWGGANLVVVLNLFTTFDQAQASIRGVTSHIHGFTADTQNRTLLLPVSCRWGLVSTIPQVDPLFKKIDQLCYSHMGFGSGRSAPASDQSETESTP